MPAIETNKWVQCSDANYWSQDERYFTIVKMPFEEWDDVNDIVKKYFCIYTQHDCPYGWNVLVHSNAELMNIKVY